MIRVAREVDLLSYLPPFMAEFKEIAVTLDAENPEFVLVWKAADRVLQNEFIETALNGATVSEVLDGQRTFDLVVRFDDQSRENLEALKRLAIELPEGGSVPLDEVADIFEGPDLGCAEPHVELAFNSQHQGDMRDGVPLRDVGRR